MEYSIAVNVGPFVVPFQIISYADDEIVFAYTTAADNVVACENSAYVPGIEDLIINF